MIRFEILTRNPHRPIIEIVSDGFNDMAHILEESKNVKAFQAFNGSAQYFKHTHGGYEKLVDKFDYSDESTYSRMSSK